MQSFIFSWIDVVLSSLSSCLKESFIIARTLPTPRWIIEQTVWRLIRPGKTRNTTSITWRRWAGLCWRLYWPLKVFSRLEDQNNSAIRPYYSASFFFVCLVLSACFAGKNWIKEQFKQHNDKKIYKKNYLHECWQLSGSLRKGPGTRLSKEVLAIQNHVVINSFINLTVWSFCHPGAVNTVRLLYKRWLGNNNVWWDRCRGHWQAGIFTFLLCETIDDLYHLRLWMELKSKLSD